MDKKQILATLLMPLLILSGCISDNANSEEDESDGVVLEVDIESTDADISVSDGTSDILIDAILQSSNQFNWSEIDVNLRYESDDGVRQSITCSQTDENAGCSISEGNGDSTWEQNEIISIAENELDICNSNNCSVYIQISLQPENEPGIILHQNELVLN